MATRKSADHWREACLTGLLVGSTALACLTAGGALVFAYSRASIPFPPGKAPELTENGERIHTLLWSIRSYSPGTLAQQAQEFLNNR